jgi:hypothetical protein
MNSSIDLNPHYEAAADSQETLPESPFRGIEPFRFIDNQVFFARKQETQKLLRYITIYRGVLLYGESGTGKSSLLNAGLFPAARGEGYAVERLRVQPRRNEEIIIERIQKTDSDADAYLPSIFADDKETATRIVLSVDAFMQRLKEASYDSYSILIFDQFEELITLFEEAPRREEQAEAIAIQEGILKALVDLLRDSSLPIKLIFGFREDYLAKLTKLFKLYPNLTDQYLRLMPLETEKLPEIIHGAIEKFPAYYEKGFSKDLADKLASAIESRSESGVINLSEVQSACLKLWHSTDPDRLFEEKGVQGLLEDSLNDSLNELTPDLREPAVALLSRMVTASGARNVVSEEDLISRVSDDENIAQDLLKRALDGLEKETKLVRRELRREVVYWEITSEFLVPWIRKKRAERLADIERRKQKEIERRRIAKGIAGLSMMLVVIIAVAAWRIVNSNTQAAQAEIAAQQAEKEKEKAEELLKVRTAAIIETEEVKKERAKAIEQMKIAEIASQQALVQTEAARKAIAELEVEKGVAEKAKTDALAQKQEAVAQKAKADDLNRQLRETQAKLKTMSEKDLGGATNRARELEVEVKGLKERLKNCK